MRPLAAKIASEKRPCDNCEALCYDWELETDNRWKEPVRLCVKCADMIGLKEADRAEMPRSQTLVFDEVTP